MGCIYSVLNCFNKNSNKNYEILTVDTPSPICYSNRFQRDVNESYRNDYYEDKVISI